jgi:hypothetical protein
MLAALFAAHDDRVPGRFDKCARVHTGKDHLVIRHICNKFRCSTRRVANASTAACDNGYKFWLYL